MEYFKTRRKSLGLTLETVAGNIGVSTRRLSKFEQGNSNLTVKEVILLCKELDFILMVVPRGSVLSEPIF